MVIINSLQNIPGHSGIKEADGKFHQFDKEIRNNGNVDSCRKMEKNPASDSLNTHSAEEQHNLCKKDKINKVDILVLYSDVYNTLGKKRENQ